MADKWIKMEEVEDSVSSVPQSLDDKQPTDWRDFMDKLVTILILAVTAGAIGYVSFLAGGYFNQPTYNKALSSIEAVAGPEVAKAYHESTRVCRDGEKLETACGLLVTVGMKPPVKLASANIQVPTDEIAQH